MKYILIPLIAAALVCGCDQDYAKSKLLTCGTCGHLVAPERAVKKPFHDYGSIGEKVYCEKDAPQCDYVARNFMGDRYFTSPKATEVKADGSPLNPPVREIEVHNIVTEKWFTNVVIQTVTNTECSRLHWPIVWSNSISYITNSGSILFTNQSWNPTTKLRSFYNSND